MHNTRSSGSMLLFTVRVCRGNMADIEPDIDIWTVTRQDMIGLENDMQRVTEKTYESLHKSRQETDNQIDAMKQTMINFMATMKQEMINFTDDTDNQISRMKKRVDNMDEKLAVVFKHVDRSTEDTQKQISILVDVFAIQIASSQYNQANQYNDLLLSRLNLVPPLDDFTAAIQDAAPLYWVIDNGEISLKTVPECGVCERIICSNVMLPCTHVFFCNACYDTYVTKHLEENKRRAREGFYPEDKLPLPLTCPQCRVSIVKNEIVDWSKELMKVDTVELMKKKPRFYIGGIFKDTRTQFERLCI